MRIDHRQIGLSEALNEHGLGTLLFDLVETTEEADAARDLEILTERLLAATEWGGRQWGVEGLPVGFLGSGLGSAAALVAAAALGPAVCAVTCRGGRPDLAGAGLPRVQAPTLLLFSGDDPVEAEAAIAAAGQLRCAQRLRNMGTGAGPDGSWPAVLPICHWMEWHLGLPEVPYQQTERWGGARRRG